MPKRIKARLDGRQKEIDIITNKVISRIQSQAPNDFLRYKPDEKVSHPEKEMYFRHLNAIKDILEEPPGFHHNEKKAWIRRFSYYEKQWSSLEDPWTCRCLATIGKQKDDSTKEELAEIINDLKMILEEQGEEFSMEPNPISMDREIYDWLCRNIDYLYRAIWRMEAREAMFKNMA